MNNKIDEKILEIINGVEKENQEHDIINNPIKIGDRYHFFEEKSFYSEKIKLVMPKDFNEMSEKDRKIKYTSENRPEIIMSNEDGSTAITLNIIESHLTNEGVLELINGMKSIIQRSNPSNIFYECKVEVINNRNIGYFDFKSIALDSNIYNIMFFFELNNKTVMGTFSCKYSEYVNWRNIAFKIIRSIKVED